MGINPLLPPPIRAAPDFIHHWFGCSAGGRAFWPLCCGYTDAFLGMCIKLFWIMFMNLHAHVYFKHILEWRFISSDFCWFVHRSGGHGTNLLVDQQKAGDALVLPRKNHQQLSLGTQIGSGSMTFGNQRFWSMSGSKPARLQYYDLEPYILPVNWDSARSEVNRCSHHNLRTRWVHALLLNIIFIFHPWINKDIHWEIDNDGNICSG